MGVADSYKTWCKNATEDKEVLSELQEIENNETEIFERFYKNLTFGTAGLRGVLGAGTNRMNIYVVRHATQGLANYINKNFGGGAVAISYDSRIKADLFAAEAAKVMAANNIKVYLTAELQPTPVLSYLVRHYQCTAGIMITASHNPAAYNGYKAYGSDGCQMTDVACNTVYDEICSLDLFNDIKTTDFDNALSQGMITYVTEDVYTAYLENVKAQQVNPGICGNSGLKVVYTPLNGTGNKLVRRVMADIGVENVAIVKEQELPDGNFTTCPYPNPEIEETLAKGIELCTETHADLLLATDPDADRVGIAVVEKDGGYRLLTGNETGIMLTEYILSVRKNKGTLPKDPMIVKTIVTSILVDRIGKKYDCEVKNVLTGFKYIGEVILNLEQNDQTDRYVFGFEESCGYLSGSYVRDKDAVVACMLICEMAAYYKKQGKTLAEVIDGLYEEYGYYQNTTLNFGFDGSAGMQKMADLMAGLRVTPIRKINGYNVVKTADYKESLEEDYTANTKTVIDLPKSDVVSYSLEGGNAVIIRPSGTEPKIKVYITAVGKNKADAQAITDKLINDVKTTLHLD